MTPSSVSRRDLLTAGVALGSPNMGRFGSRGEIQQRMSNIPVAVSVSKV